MADYYSILSRTISGLGQNSDAMRETVYGKARAAIDRQLRAMDPAPGEEAIARQMQLLEDAIGKIEAENSSSTVEQEPRIDELTQNKAPSVGNDSAAKTELPVTPSVGAPDPVISTNESVAAPSIDDPRGMDYQDTILAEEPTAPLREADKAKSGFFSALVPVLLAIAVIGGGIYALWINKDALIDALLNENSAPEIENTTTKSQLRDKSEPELEQPAIVNSQTANEQKPNSNIRVVGNDPVIKTESKLTPQGDTVEPEPATPATGGQAIDQTSSPTDINPTNDLAPTDPAPIDPASVGNDPQVTDVTPQTSGETNATDEATTVAAEPSPTANSTEQSGAAPVAQSAFLYEEGSAGANASRDNAAIIWSLEKEANQNGVQEAVIKGQLDIPSRGLNMALSLKRNLDDSLPASHIIEIQFTVPPEFRGGNISSVARFVMKSSEQARGEGLVAVPAKISNGYFLIALNNLEQALQTNRKLLLESSWIDIPLGYTTGRRALITLEKGALGTKVFKDAFADWDSR